MGPFLCELIMKPLCDLGPVMPISGPSFRLLYNDFQTFDSLEFWPKGWLPLIHGDQKQWPDHRQLDRASFFFHASVLQ